MYFIRTAQRQGENIYQYIILKKVPKLGTDFHQSGHDEVIPQRWGGAIS